MAGHNDNGIARLAKKLSGLAHIDFTPLMKAWEDNLQIGNREGIMAGLDGYGNPMVPVTYRPKIAKGGPHKGPSQALQAKWAAERRAHAQPAWTGDLAYNNLTSAHYRTLSGPPLAPRGLLSRVITNFRTAFARVDDKWMITWAWEGVVSPKGVPFLGFHFRGEGRLPVRDLRRIRPNTVKVCRDDLKRFMRYVFDGADQDYQSHITRMKLH